MFANTKKQTLIDHSIAVACLAQNIFKRTLKKEDFDNFLEEIDFNNKKKFAYDKVLNTVFLTGLFHDIGKIDENFQDYINRKIEANDLQQESDFQIEALKKMKKKIDIFEYPLHNEISFAFSSALLETPYFSDMQLRIIGDIFNNVVLFHHAKLPRTNKDFSNSIGILKAKNFNFADFFINAKQFIFDINDKLLKYNIFDLKLNDNFDDLDDELILNKNINAPSFQRSDIDGGNKRDIAEKLFKGAIGHLVRSVIVSADRMISASDADFISEIIEDNDYDCFSFDDVIDINSEIGSMIDMFNVKYGDSERSKEQSRVAKELSQTTGVAVLKGPAGVGKTKIMLEWVKNIDSKKRTYIIVPKKAIGMSLYNEIRSEYLKNVNVEIITGDIKERSFGGDVFEVQDHEVFSGEVVITTIDQILNMMLSHSKIDVFFDILNSNLIFDEFHEFLYIPAISVLFMEIIYLKHVLKNNNCLLVSATPNSFFLKKLMIGKNKVKKIKSFNPTKYKINIIEFDDMSDKNLINNEMFKTKEKGEICIFNTATKAQISGVKCINNGEKNTLIFHSKFNKSSRSEIFSRIMREFGKKTPTRNNVLRVGPILQASVDISTNHMHTEISNIDNIYQRLGRVVRWGEAEKGNYSIYIPRDMNVGGSIRSELINVSCVNSASIFVDFIKSKIDKNREYDLNELYEFYDLFFEENKSDVIKAYEEDFSKMLSNSTRIFEQNFEPIKTLNKKDKKSKKDEMTLPKKSLRGSSMFFYVKNMNIDKNNNVLIDDVKEMKENIISMGMNDFYGHDNFEKYLSEMRDQLYYNNGKNKILEDITANIKESSYKIKKSSKGVLALPLRYFENFSRSESIPIVLSFEGKIKHLSNEDQFYNLTYKGVKVGVIKKEKIDEII